MINEMAPVSLIDVSQWEARFVGADARVLVSPGFETGDDRSPIEDGTSPSALGWLKDSDPALLDPVANCPRVDAQLMGDLP